MSEKPSGSKGALVAVALLAIIALATSGYYAIQTVAIRDDVREMKMKFEGMKMAPKPAVREIAVTSDLLSASNRFTPSVILAYQGDTLKLKVTNLGDKEHGFSIDEYKVAEVVDKGKTISVEIKADTTGVFRVYCQLHAAHMGGQLLVLPR